jgi:hypothetical protein
VTKSRCRKVPADGHYESTEDRRQVKPTRGKVSDCLAGAVERDRPVHAPAARSRCCPSVPLAASLGQAFFDQPVGRVADRDEGIVLRASAFGELAPFRRQSLEECDASVVPGHGLNPIGAPSATEPQLVGVRVSVATHDAPGAFVTL